ncbi:MAG: TonB-dependent receptor [Balneolales bacterium]
MPGFYLGRTVFNYVRGIEREGEYFSLPFMPPINGHITIRYSTGDWWNAPRVRMVGKQNHVAPKEDTTPGYRFLALDAGYRMSKGITLAMRLDNILNVSYKDHLSRIEDRNNPMPRHKKIATGYFGALLFMSASSIT